MPRSLTTSQKMNAAKFVRASSQFLSISDNASLSMGAGVRFTMGGWIYADSLPAAGSGLIRGIMGKFEAADFEYAMEVRGSGSPVIRINASSNGTSATSVESGVILSTGTWYFVLFWYDGAKIYCSVNNANEVSTAFTADVRNGTSLFKIGVRGDTGASHWDGRMAGLFVSKKVFSATERTQMYNNGLGLPANALDAGLKTSMSAFWNLEGGSLADSIGSNTLTNNNGVGSAAGIIGIVRTVAGTRSTTSTKVSDTFTRPDSSTSLGSTENKVTTWGVTGTWGINSNRGANKASGDQYATVNSGISDCTFQVACTRNASRIGILGRNRLRLWSEGGTNIILTDINTNTQLGIATIPAWGATQTKTLKMEMVGDSIKCYVDGTLYITITSSLNQTNTTHGLYSNSASDSSLFDNFLITQPVADARTAASYRVPVDHFPISDNFNRANASTLGTATTGHIWEDIVAGIGITSNKAAWQSGSGDKFAVLQAYTPNCIVQGTLARGGNATSAMFFRVINSSNYFKLEVATNFQVTRVINGSPTTVSGGGASGFGLTNNTSGVYKIELRGSTVRLFKNGSFFATFTDSNLLTGTKHGVGTTNNADAACTIDDFSITLL